MIQFQRGGLEDVPKGMEPLVTHAEAASGGGVATPGCPPQVRLRGTWGRVQFPSSFRIVCSRVFPDRKLFYGLKQ